MPTFLSPTQTAINAGTRIDASLRGGVLKVWKDSVPVPVTANGDLIIVTAVSIDYIVSSVRIATTNLSSGTLNVGLYTRNADGLTYTAVAAQAFASLLALGSGAILVTDITYENAIGDIAKSTQPLWQRAGLTTRPFTYTDLYIGIATPTAIGAAGTISLEVYAS